MIRIAYGRLFHEANAYSPLRTTVEDFDRMHHLAGDALAQATTLRGIELKSFMPHAELTGFRQAVRLARDVEAVPLESALAVPNGPMTRACWDELTGSLLDRLKRAMPLDGVYLALHGSMQVEGLTGAPEGELLRRVRAIVGDRVKVAVSYDHHANKSAGLVDTVDVLIAYRSNPHWDLAPTGFRAGRRLLHAIRGEIRPVHAWKKLPMLLGGGMTIDFLKPMRGVFKDMKRLERDPRVISASLFMVHPYTDAEELGWAAHVSTNDEPALANELLDRLGDRLWEMRKHDLPPMFSPQAAIEETRRTAWHKAGPVTFVDVDDVVSAGAPGGNTHVLSAFVEHGRGLLAYVPIHDPEVVASFWDATPGTRRRVVFRGTPGYGMPPVEVDVVLSARATTDCGRAVRLDGGDLRIVATEHPPLPIHPSFWSALGLRARSADVIVQKNFFHYRMFHLTTTFRHLPVVSAGATSLVEARARFDAKAAAKAKMPAREWTSTSSSAAATS
jgi:microcystin degradation protein MlrC